MKMKVISVKLTFSSILLMASFSLLAQEQWGEGGEIESVEIQITKEKQITLPRATRNFEKVPPRPVEPIQPAMTYDFKSFRFDTKDAPISIKPLRLKTEELSKINGGYVSVGLGNFASPTLSAAFNSKRNANKFYGANLFHHSFGKGPVSGKNSASGETQLHVFTNGFNDKLSGGLSATYENLITHFYGYQPSTREVKRDTIRQQFNRVTIAGQVGNVKPDDFNFLLKGEFNYLDDYVRASESIAGLHFGSDYKINDKSLFLFTGDYRLTARKDTLVEAKPRSLLRIAPAYQFSPMDKLTLTGGLRFAYENDTIGKSTPVHVYPDIRASYQIGKSLDAFAQFAGDMEQVSLHSLTRENLWLGSNVNIFHANKALEVRGGLKGKVGSLFTFQAGGAATAWKHNYFFLNNAIRPEKFDVVYDDVTVGNAFAEWSITNAKKASLTMRGDYYSYSTKTLKEAWHRPTYQLSVFTHYNFYEKLSMDANLVARGGMKAWDAATSRVMELKAAVDLNVKLRYFVSKDFSCYVEGNNLLNSDYPLYFHYPVRGLQVGAGVSWSF